MTPSALEKDIQDIQEKLARLSCEIEKFEAQSKTTISADHTMMLSQLRESVDAVHHTNHFLETGHSRVIKHIHMIPGAWVEDIPTEDAVKLHSEDIHAKFSSLRDTTKSALVRVEEIKEQCDDFDVSLDRITNEVKAVTTRAKSALGTAQSSLAAKETQLANTKKTLTEKQGQIQNMESQMKSKRDDRDIMRVARGLSWAGGILFPPLLAVAGGLEVGAAVMRNERRELQQQLNAEETKVQSLQAERDTLERQQKTLADAVTSSNTLLWRCEKVSSGSSEVHTIVERRLEEYHDLVNKTDEFGAWTKDLANNTASLKLLGTSEKSLQRIVRRIVVKMLEFEHDDVKAICDKLKVGRDERRRA